MTDIPDPPPGEADEGARSARPGRSRRRREKIVAEIERNRRGEYTVPTWALVLILLALIGGWLAFVLAV